MMIDIVNEVKGVREGDEKLNLLRELIMDLSKNIKENGRVVVTEDLIGKFEGGCKELILVKDSRLTDMRNDLATIVGESKLQEYPAYTWGQRQEEAVAGLKSKVRELAGGELEGELNRILY